MGDQEETQLKNVVSPIRNNEPVYDGELSPALNDSGNIQAAQPQQPQESHDLYDTDTDDQEPNESEHLIVYTHSGTHDISEEEDPFIYGNADDKSSSQTPSVGFTNDYFNQLDAALDGLTKDLYISKLLQQ